MPIWSKRTGPWLLDHETIVADPVPLKTRRSLTSGFLPHRMVLMMTQYSNSLLSCLSHAHCGRTRPGPERGGSVGPPKLQALIITGQNSHDWKGTTPILRQALEETGRFEVRVTEEFRGAGSETLAPYDVVIVNYFERRQPQLRWGERTDAAFLDYVRSGKGLVLYHFSLAAFTGWADYEKMSGGNWRVGSGHHSARHDFLLTSRMPITR